MKEDTKIILDKLRETVLVSWDTESNKVVRILEDVLACAPKLGDLVSSWFTSRVVEEPVPHSFYCTTRGWMAVKEDLMGS